MTLHSTLLMAVLLAAGWASAPAQESGTTTIPLRSDGTIPAWIVAGPFEQPTTGFGIPVDTDLLGEATLEPYEGKVDSTGLVEGGTVRWGGQSPDSSGILDFAETLGWAVPGRIPEKLWFSKVGYAWTRVFSPDAREALLLLGSNASLRVLVNGAVVSTFGGERQALPNQDTVRVTLRHGVNTLLVKVGNSHQNFRLEFFGGTPWEWGAYVRVVDPAGRPMPDLRVELQRTRPAPALAVRSTFFFRTAPQGLLQRFDCVVSSPWPDTRPGVLFLEAAGTTEKVKLPGIRFGENRFPLFLPAVEKNLPVRCRLEVGGTSTAFLDTLRVRKRYELNLMLLTHLDIGYTHIQPVVKELHVRTLDQVLAFCRKDPQFRWTIETVWQLREFERSRPRAVFEELIGYIREGRIAVSPFLSNPFTGWVSEEEMIRSLSDASSYRARFGITSTGAVYNDVPGLAWFIPRVLQSAGVSLIACGINEVYGGYTLQQSLPKSFVWEGGDGSRVIVYRSETYNEGKAYGLERDERAVEQRTWERLERIRAAGDDRDMVLLDAAWMDNGGVAEKQFQIAKKWNALYAYPRFVFTTIADFANRFAARHGKSLPVLRGDWTSAWDIRFQGEPARTIRERWAQQHLPVAEGLDAVNSLRDTLQHSLRAIGDRAYASLLEYSGHGSGLEYGYGTRTENALTMDYREGDVRLAVLSTRELLARGLTRLVMPEESFAGEGILVWNPLSWACDVPLDIELRDSTAVQFALTEMATGSPLPARRDGYHLFAVARGVPPLGFKKIALRALPAGMPQSNARGLTLSATAVENVFYRVTFDTSSRRITGIRDLRLNKEILMPEGRLFNEPLVQQAFVRPDYLPLLSDAKSITVIDRRPANLQIVLGRPGQLFTQTTYTLWNGIPRVDVAHAVDLARLRPPPTAEAYAVGFPFALRSPQVRMDVLGGSLTVGRDRLPGALQDAFAIRRTVGLSDGSLSVDVSSTNARVVFWQSDRPGNPPILLANVVNNFPPEWNRNEENAGVWTFRFSVQSGAGSFDPERTARFGWETQTEFPAIRTWLRPTPAETSFVTLTGKNVLLVAFERSAHGEGVLVRLANASPDSSATGFLSSPLLTGMHIFEANVLEIQGSPLSPTRGVLKVVLRPSELRTLLFERAQVH